MTIMTEWTKYITIVILLGLSGSVYSQSVRWPRPDQPSKQEIYSKASHYILKLSPAGMQFSYRFGSIPNFYTENYYQFEIGQTLHPRELGSGLQALKTSISRGFFKNYTYGKQNSLYTLRASQGRTVYLSDKVLEKNIRLGYTYRYGISAGLIKPYYLQVPKENDGFFNRDFEYIKYTEENREQFLDDEEIFGKAPFRYGFNEIRFAPGIHGQGGMVFDWSKDERSILATEIGLMIDFYFSSIPLMVDQSNKPFFLNLYISLHLGKRK